MKKKDQNLKNKYQDGDFIINKIRNLKMRKPILLLVILLNTLMVVDLLAQELPLVYDVENTGADCPVPYLPPLSELPVFQPLPDPFEWADGRGRITNFSDWRYRRAEIGAQIQNYEIGEKPPRPDSITASYSDSVLTVNVTVNGKTLTLTSSVILPSGTGPFPAIIGMTLYPSSVRIGSLPDSIFTSRNVATIKFDQNQITTNDAPSTSDPYYRLYTNLNPNNTGQYSAWAWGVSRIIDGLELVQNVLPIDLKHIAVTGCSFFGGMALFAGAFDERIALTIAIESGGGGGGAFSWRYSHDRMIAGDINYADYNAFMNSMKQFSGDNVYRLPEDHHELMAMVAPRALYVTGNPGYEVLANPSCYVASNGVKQVYEALGIPDRFGFSLVGGHDHCALPESQIPEIEAFVDKFLLGKDTVNTNNISDRPDSYNDIDLSPWITWTNPALGNDTSYFGKTDLIYPPDFQAPADTNITFKWRKVIDAEEYFIQLSNDPTFENITVYDSTADTVKTINNLPKGKKFYWRVQIKSSAALGPWSNLRHFTTVISLPAKPELVSVTQDSDQIGWYTFTWKKVKDATEYLVQTSEDSAFTNIFASGTTSDTSKVLQGFSDKQEYYWRVQASNIGGSGPWSNIAIFPHATGVKEKEGLPTEYSISQNFPNPFNPTTRIKFALPKTALTKIIVYDLIGRKIRTLINKELKGGYYEISFDANNLPSGVYFYRIQAGSFIATKKLLLLK
jgi:hypothetical protein